MFLLNTEKRRTSYVYEVAFASANFALPTLKMRVSLDVARNNSASNS